MVVIADSGKIVTKLGTKSMLPVEVTKFGHEVQDEFFRSLGATPVLRRTDDGTLYVTDNGNYSCDLRFPSGIADPAGLENKLLHHAGIVETGLFLGIASVALIAGEKDVERRDR